MKFIVDDKISNDDFIRKLVSFAEGYATYSILNSNGTTDEYNVLAGLGAKKIISSIHDEAFGEETWKFGYVSYDYKNKIEQLRSDNPDRIGAKQLYFFVPEVTLLLSGSVLEIIADSGEAEQRVYDQLINASLKSVSSKEPCTLIPAMTKEQYLQAVRKIKDHIAAGDIYEMNYCMEFYNDNATINPAVLYLELNEISEAPFSFMFKDENLYAIGSSPERFLKKHGNKLITQPIKGTARRAENLAEDTAIKAHLYYDEKERNENVMIVDVSRNDLSRVAEKGSVRVDELFGIYSFKQVHQMISTVSCTVSASQIFKNIIGNTFPPASMTGAPKISAMKIAEEYETFKRGMYSGVLGYIKPNNDFDFNVVIRSILYNKERKSISVAVGSAITNKCIPEKEYDECLLKAKAMKEVLEGKSV